MILDAHLWLCVDLCWCRAHAYGTKPKHDRAVKYVPSKEEIELQPMSLQSMNPRVRVEKTPETPNLLQKKLGGLQSRLCDIRLQETIEKPPWLCHLNCLYAGHSILIFLYVYLENISVSQNRHA